MCPGVLDDCSNFFTQKQSHVIEPDIPVETHNVINGNQHGNTILCKLYSNNNNTPSTAHHMPDCIPFACRRFNQFYNNTNSDFLC